MWNIEGAIAYTIFGLRLSKHWRRHIYRWTLYIANMTPWATLGRGFAFTTRFGQWFEVAKGRPISSLLLTPTTKLSITNISIYENKNIIEILPMREISDWNEITGTFPEPAIMIAIACRISLTAVAVDITTIVPFRVTTEAPSIDLLAPAATVTCHSSKRIRSHMDRLGKLTIPYTSVQLPKCCRPSRQRHYSCPRNCRPPTPSP